MGVGRREGCLLCLTSFQQLLRNHYNHLLIGVLNSEYSNGPFLARVKLWHSHLAHQTKNLQTAFTATSNLYADTSVCHGFGFLALLLSLKIVRVTVIAQKLVQARSSFLTC